MVRQAGQFERKGDAVAHTAAVVAQRNRERAADPSVPTLDAFLRRCLAKTTIDGAFSAFSALLRDAMDIELVDANVAARMRVRPADPRLRPTRGPVQRRSVPPAEIHAFMAAVPPHHRAVCWAPVLTGCRPAELFAIDDDHLDRAGEMVYLHQTVDRYGHLMNGLKGTHHIAEESKRGRWTLFARPLIDMLNQRARNRCRVRVSVPSRQVVVGPQLLPRRVGAGSPNSCSSHPTRAHPSDAAVTMSAVPPSRPLRSHAAGSGA